MQGWGVIGGLRGAVSPPLWGLGQRPGIFFFGPIVLSMVLCMVFAQGFARDGFWSMVLDALACIYMYCNIERNIMKNQFGSPGFGI